MISRARRLAAVAIGGALLWLPALTGIAHAAPSKVYAVPLARIAADVKRVADYWKPDRLKLADKYTPATPGASGRNASAATGTGAPTSVAAVSKTLAAQSVAAVAPRTGTAQTMGKVFFRFGDKEYWCSGSAVAAKNRSVVATAGHCAYDARQARAADYWIFVPNPGPHGETPAGIYVGASISMHEDWVGKGDYDYDYAFVTVHRGFTWTAKDGDYVMTDAGRLQDNVGGLGIELNKKPGTYTVAPFGYPAGAQPNGKTPFDGRALRQCPAAPTHFREAPTRDVQKGVELRPCDFSAGASGGPWVIGYDRTSRLGLLNGVVSLTWRNPAGYYESVSSPYFDTVTGEVYRRAAGLTTPSKVT